MSALRPRSQLETHDVSNQPRPSRTRTSTSDVGPSGSLRSRGAVALSRSPKPKRAVRQPHFHREIDRTGGTPRRRNRCTGTPGSGNTPAVAEPPARWHSVGRSSQPLH
jgi:hypothetical protein